MQHLTIALNDDQIEHLRELARQRGETPEQAAASLLGILLPTSAPARETAAPTLSSALDLSGLVDDATIVPLSSEDMDRLLAAEALNPHDDQ